MSTLRALLSRYPGETKVLGAVLGVLLTLIWLRWPYDATYDLQIRRAIERQLRTEFVLWAGDQVRMSKRGAAGIDQVAGQRYAEMLESYRPPRIESITVRGRASTRMACVVLADSPMPFNAQPVRFYSMRTQRLRGFPRTGEEDFLYSRGKAIFYWLKVL